MHCVNYIYVLNIYIGQTEVLNLTEIAPSRLHANSY